MFERKLMITLLLCKNCIQTSHIFFHFFKIDVWKVRAAFEVGQSQLIAKIREGEWIHQICVSSHNLWFIRRKEHIVAYKIDKHCFNKNILCWNLFKNWYLKITSSNQRKWVKTEIQFYVKFHFNFQTKFSL